MTGGPEGRADVARLFIAIDPPPAVAAAAAALRAPLPGARWVREDQLHLTLRFLGEVREEAIAALRRDLATVKGQFFALALRGVGVFPPPRPRKPARVLWTGVAPAGPIRALAGAIAAALGTDAENDEREFSPHLTLARFREPPGAALEAFLARHAAFSTPSWRVEEYHLYRSTLGAAGARHDLVERFPLAA